MKNHVQSAQANAGLHVGSPSLLPSSLLSHRPPAPFLGSGPPKVHRLLKFTSPASLTNGRFPCGLGVGWGMLTANFKTSQKKMC